MKYIIVSILLCFQTQGKAQNLKNKEYHTNGKLKMEYEGEEGTPDGLVKIYYETGDLQGILNFKKGIQQGKTTFYYPSGKIYKEINTKDGIPVDTMKIYHKNGNLQELSIIKNQAKNGLFRTYYENGQLELDGFTKDGIAHGFCTYYQENGDTLNLGEFNMGKKVGLWLVYDAAGVTYKNYGTREKVDCESMRTGKFTESNNKDIGTTYITRTETEQYEVNQKMDLKLKYNVRWTDECTYRLFSAQILKNKKYESMNNPDTLIVRIFETDDKGYTASVNTTHSGINTTLLILKDTSGQ